MAFPLPGMIEHLLTRRESGRALVFQAESHLEIDNVPAGVEVDLSLLPGGTDFAALVYQIAVDPSVVPGAFYGFGQYFASRLYAGTITNWWTVNEVGAFIMIRDAEPASLKIRNQTNADQYYSGIVFYLAIRNQEDYRLVMEELRRVDRMEELAFKQLTAILGKGGG